MSKKPRSSPPPPNSIYNTEKRRKLRRTDVYLAPPVKIRDEIFLRENDHFVGATATFNDAWDIVPQLNPNMPSGYFVLISS